MPVTSDRPRCCRDGHLQGMHLQVGQTGTAVMTSSACTTGPPHLTANPPPHRARQWSGSSRCAETTSGPQHESPSNSAKPVHAVSRRTITRHLAHLGLNRRRFIDPHGHTTRKPRTITARRPGHMVHIDVKKGGRTPDGSGWRAHGRDNDHSRAVSRNKKKTGRGGHVYLHSAVDGHTRLAYTDALAG